MGKIAVVTSVGQGIGKATAGQLSDDGATVVVNYIGHSEVVNEFVSELTEKGVKQVRFVR